MLKGQYFFADMLRIDTGKVAYFLESDLGGTVETKVLKMVTDIHTVVKLFHNGGTVKAAITVKDLM